MDTERRATSEASSALLWSVNRSTGSGCVAVWFAREKNSNLNTLAGGTRASPEGNEGFLSHKPVLLSSARTLDHLAALA